MDLHKPILRKLVGEIGHVQKHLALSPALLEDAVNQLVLTIPEKQQIESCSVSGAGALGVVWALCCKDSGTLRTFIKLLDTHNQGGLVTWLERALPEARESYSKKTRSTSATPNSAHPKAQNRSRDLVNGCHGANSIQSGPLLAARANSQGMVPRQREHASDKHTTNQSSYSHASGRPSSSGRPGRLPEISSGLASASKISFIDESDVESRAESMVYERKHSHEKNMLLQSIDTDRGQRLKQLERLNLKLQSDIEEVNRKLEGKDTQIETMMMFIYKMQAEGGPRGDLVDSQISLLDDIQALKDEIAEKELGIKDLEKELFDFRCKMKEKEELINALSKALKESRDREKELRQILGITEKADYKEVLNNIKEMKESNSSANKDKIQDLEKELSKRKDLQKKLKEQEKQLEALKFDKNCLNQILRNRRLVKRTSEMDYKVRSVTLSHNTRSAITSFAKWKDNRLTDSLTLKLHSEPSQMGGKLYCVLCHSSFEMATNRNCFVHYEGCQNSRWQCCRQDSKAGCLSLRRHFCIIIQQNSTCILTNGEQSLEIKASFLND